jgi:thioredoxin 1
VKELTSENFEEVANSEKGLFIIKFFSDTCGPCKTLDPVFNLLEEKNPIINFYKVNTGLSPELAEHFEVRGVPTVVYCENREILYRFVGLTPLVDFQYVIDNINDPYFRETGNFKLPEKKKDWIYIGVIILITIIFLILFFFN